MSPILASLLSGRSQTQAGSHVTPPHGCRRVCPDWTLVMGRAATQPPANLKDLNIGEFNRLYQSYSKSSENFSNATTAEKENACK